MTAYNSTVFFISSIFFWLFSQISNDKDEDESLIIKIYGQIVIIGNSDTHVKLESDNTKISMWYKDAICSDPIYNPLLGITIKSLCKLKEILNIFKRHRFNCIIDDQSFYIVELDGLLYSLPLSVIVNSLSEITNNDIIKSACEA